jgi:hypothetical protein
MDIQTAVSEYVTKLQYKMDQHCIESKYSWKEKVEAKVSGKYCKIVVSHMGASTGGGYAYAFVALTDNETKGLGKVKQGDLLKPASWNAPTKWARGNVIENMDKALEASGHYGVAYLR